MTQYLKSSDQDTVWTHVPNAEYRHYMEYFSFSPDDSIIIASQKIAFLQDDLNAVCRIETITGKILNQYYPIAQARFTPDGNYIIGKNRDSLVLLTADSLIKVNRFDTTNYFVSVMAFNDDFTKIYSGNAYGLGYKVWDFNTGKVIKDTTILKNESNDKHEYVVNDIKIINDSLALFDVLETKQMGNKRYGQIETVCVDLAADTVKYILYYMSIEGMALSHDKTKFCSSSTKQSDSNFLKIYDVYTGSVIDTMPLTNISRCEFTHDDRYIVKLTSKPIFSLQVWDITTKELKYLYNQTDSSIYRDFSISNSDQYLVAGILGYSYLYNNRWNSNGIINSTITNQVITYPNPATDFIEISVGVGSKPALTGDIKIYNIYGQTVFSVGAILELPSRIDVSGLVPGMYFVRIGDKVEKFIKI